MLKYLSRRPVMESLIQLRLEDGPELLQLLYLRMLKSFDVGSGTCSELLLVFIPILLEFLQVVLLLS